MSDEKPLFSKVAFNALTASHDDIMKRMKEKGKQPYEVGRGLHSKRIDAETVALGYCESLPTWEDKDVAAVIAEKIAENGTAYVADFGYGLGNFLLEVANEFPETTIIGFGRSDFAKLGIPDRSVPPTFAQLNDEKRIQLVEGELPLEDHQIAFDSQDVITVNNVFQYLNKEVKYKTIKDIYLRLKAKGIGLINNVGLPTEEITQLMSELGIPSEDYHSQTSDLSHIRQTLAFTKG